MSATRDLIEGLVAQAQPVRPLRAPVARTFGWLLLALALLSVLAAGRGFRPDLAQQLQSGTFRNGLAASVVTGMLAAAGCLLASLPDRSRLWLLLPVPSAAVWVGIVGTGCLGGWVGLDWATVTAGELLSCSATVLAVSLPLSLAMFVLLRHAARLRPALVTMTAGLAVAAFSSAAVALLHQIDESAMILFWNLGTAAGIVALEGAAGRRVLGWCASALKP